MWDDSTGQVVMITGRADWNRICHRVGDSPRKVPTSSALRSRPSCSGERLQIAESSGVKTLCIVREVSLNRKEPEKRLSRHYICLEHPDVLVCSAGIYTGSHWLMSPSPLADD